MMRHSEAGQSLSLTFCLKVVLLSDVPLNYLFSNEKPSEMYTSDEHRSLMDDLKITKDSVSCATSGTAKHSPTNFWFRLTLLQTFLQVKKKCSRLTAQSHV